MSFNIRDGQSEITGDFSGLEKLLKNLDSDLSVDIGYFKDAKTPDGQSVAGYMAANEFGSIERKLPVRSSIRMPLETKQSEISTYVSGRSKYHLEQGDIKAIFEDIGIAGQSKIQEAFDTRGFGTWAPDAEVTIERKGSDAPLIDSGLARKAVTYRVGEK
jgi:hypothetical protein